MSLRERVASCRFLVILYQMDKFFLYIILYHIFMFNLVELVRPFYCLVLLADLTHLTCLSRSRNTTPILLTLSVSDVPIEHALLSVPFLWSPTSTCEACSTASTSSCLPSLPSCPVAMCVLKNGSSVTLP
jgi:hypothetical protein